MDGLCCEPYPKHKWYIQTHSAAEHGSICPDRQKKKHSLQNSTYWICLLLFVVWMHCSFFFFFQPVFGYIYFYLPPTQFLLLVIFVCILNKQKRRANNELIFTFNYSSWGNYSRDLSICLLFFSYLVYN